MSAQTKLVTLAAALLLCGCDDTPDMKQIKNDWCAERHGVWVESSSGALGTGVCFHTDSIIPVPASVGHDKK